VHFEGTKMARGMESEEMLKSTASSLARRSLISLTGKAIETPHYVAVTSRGVVPHVSPDVLARHTSIKAVYFGLEDCK
jgi:queuine tRNA-ribosyltransferase accessory subunit